MSNIEINGMNPHTTKVSVLVDHLERIGNELRVHFGKKQEGTAKFHFGSDPLVLKGGGMKNLDAGYFEFIVREDLIDYLPPDPEQVLSVMYDKHFDKNIYVEQMTEPLVRTIKVPGATGMRIKMSYSCRGGSGRPQGYLQGNYLWIGAGLHEDASKVQGEYYPEFQAGYWHEWEKLEEHSIVCAKCGLPAIIVNGKYEVIPTDNDPQWKHECLADSETGRFPLLHSGPVLPIVEREIKGDSFTCAWMVDFTDYGYSGQDKKNRIGYYIEITPYNEFGPMTNYNYIVDEIPLSFSIDDMDHMVSKLNNYPNAEEVKF